MVGVPEIQTDRQTDKQTHKIQYRIAGVLKVKKTVTSYILNLYED